MSEAPSDFDNLPLLRVPPSSIESESSILGGLLLDNKAWDRVGDLLVDSDFYRFEHRLIYATIGGLINANREADVITVFEVLRQTGKAEEAGGLAYLNSLAQYVPSASNIRRYAEIVREKAVLRKLVTAGDEIAASAFDTEGRPVADIQDAAERKILGIGEETGRLQEGFKSMDSIVVEILDRVQELADSPDAFQGLATGFYDLDHMTLGFQPGDLVVLAARPSMGKSQPLTSKVLLRDGSWKSMGAIQVGDELASPDGRPSTVLGVYPQGVLPVHSIHFSDGRSAEACGEHLWRVDFRHWDDARILSTAAISALLTKQRYQKRMWIDMPSGDFGSDQALPIDPWLLGALIGNGNLPSAGSIRITTDKPHTLGRIQAALPPGVTITSHGIDHALVTPRGAGNPLIDAIAALGLRGRHSHEKFVPSIYLQASREQRLELLHGLMDTDGWCEKTGSAQYSTASAQLASDVQALVRSLGGWAARRIKLPTYTYKGEKLRGRQAHTVSVVLQESPFTLPMKRARHARPAARRKRPTISGVTYLRDTEAQCIKVSHPSSLYITDDYVVTHNTALAMNIAEHVAINERLPVAVFSMEMGAQQLGVRLLGTMGRIDQGHLRTGKLTEDEWPRFIEAIEKLRGASLHIEERGAMTANEMRAGCRRLVRQVGKLGLIVVDYIQLMGTAGSGRSDNRATEVGDMTRQLKALAKEMQCPVIALSQLSRNVESRTDKRPMMSDLRESGAIEQDADVIIFIYRDDYYNKEQSKEPGVAEIILSKQRNGPTGTIKMAFQKHLTRFDNLSRP